VALSVLYQNVSSRSAIRQDGIGATISYRF